MTMWNVYGKVHATKFLGTFEADTEELAIEIAMEKNGSVSVCHQCDSEVGDPEIDGCIAEQAT